MVLFYYGKTFERARAGARLIRVVCSNCGCEYFYELARIGTGASTASYGIGQTRAERKAAEQSEVILHRRLEREAELVPCPNCNWINDELVEGYRRSRYRFLGVFAMTIGFAGAVLSLVVAWYISIGPPADRRSLPYFLIGGPLVFACFTVGLLLLRSFLRSRIRPNHEFPSPPRLPFGSPPALLMDKVMGLCLAMQTQPSSSDNEGMLALQFGRHELPTVCCQCLEPASAKHGHPIQVTRLVQFAIPLCDDCGDSYQRKFRKISSIIFGIGLLVEFALAATMWLLSMEWWLVIVSMLLAFGAIAVVAMLVASALAAPVKVVSRDGSRGVVQLRFRNADYVERIVELANASVDGPPSLTTD